MQTVLFLHVICAVLWLGSALVESVGEANPTTRTLVSFAQGRFDLVVALPAFLGLLLTGGYLASHEALTPMNTLKIAAGLIAIGANIYGLLLVRDMPVARGDGAARRAARRFRSPRGVGDGVGDRNPSAGARVRPPAGYRGISGLTTAHGWSSVGRERVD